MPHPSIHAQVSPDVAENLSRQARIEGTSMSEIVRRALNEYLLFSDGDEFVDEPVEATETVIENVNTEEEEDSMRLNGQVELRFHKNTSGSVSVFAMDPVTGEKLGSVVRFNNDGSLRRIQGADRIPGIKVNTARKNRIALSEQPLRRNANR